MKPRSSSPTKNPLLHLTMPLPHVFDLLLLSIRVKKKSWKNMSKGLPSKPTIMSKAYFITPPLLPFNTLIKPPRLMKIPAYFS